jgi:hypothetical protein
MAARGRGPPAAVVVAVQQGVGTGQHSSSKRPIAVGRDMTLALPGAVPAAAIGATVTAAAARPSIPTVRLGTWQRLFYWAGAWSTQQQRPLLQLRAVTVVQQRQQLAAAGKDAQGRVQVPQSRQRPSRDLREHRARSSSSRLGKTMTEISCCDLQPTSSGNFLLLPLKFFSAVVELSLSCKPSPGRRRSPGERSFLSQLCTCSLFQRHTWY